MSFRRLERIMLKTRQSRSDPLPDPMTSGSGDSRRVDKQELAQLFASHTLSPPKAFKTSLPVRSLQLWLNYQRFFGAAVNSRQ